MTIDRAYADTVIDLDSDIGVVDRVDHQQIQMEEKVISIDVPTGPITVAENV